MEALTFIESLCIQLVFCYCKLPLDPSILGRVFVNFVYCGAVRGGAELTFEIVEADDDNWGCRWSSPGRPTCIRNFRPGVGGDVIRRELCKPRSIFCDEKRNVAAGPSQLAGEVSRELIETGKIARKSLPGRAQTAHYFFSAVAWGSLLIRLAPASASIGANSAASRVSGSFAVMLDPGTPVGAIRIAAEPTASRLILKARK